MFTKTKQENIAAEEIMTTFIFMAFTRSGRHWEFVNTLKFLHFSIIWDQRNPLMTTINKKGNFLLCPEFYGH